MSGPSRRPEIRRRRTRKEKLALLRRRYATATSEGDKKKILEKVHRIHPQLTPEHFLKPLEKKEA